VDPDGVPAAVAERARAWGAERAVVATDPLLERLGVAAALADAGVRVVRWPTGATWRDLLGLDGPAATVGVTAPALAVAERGTLLLEAAPGHGRSIDVASMFHLAVLAADRIVPTLADALARTYRGGRRPPSAVSLVSGPSRSSDIEKISTLGAHGALAEHVIVVSGPS
jgi:L-lactate dehydrogenase complex protein LldG